MGAVEVKGVNGVVSFDGHEVMIRRRRLYGWSERAMPLVGIAAVQLHRPTWSRAGYVQFLTAGASEARNPRQAARDGAAVLIARRQFKDFEHLVRHIRAVTRGEAGPVDLLKPVSSISPDDKSHVRRGGGRRPILIGAGCVLGGVVVLTAVGSTLPKTVSDPAERAGGPPGPDAAAVASFAATRRKLPILMSPCDRAIERAASIRGRSTGYAAAVKAEALCNQSSSELLGLSHGPALNDQARTTLDKAVHCYGFAYGQRAGAMAHATKIIDNQDLRPSEVAAFRSELADAIARSRECGDQYAAAELRYGFEEPVVDGALKPHHQHGS